MTEVRAQRSATPSTPTPSGSPGFSRSAGSWLGALLGSAHPGPAVAVTVLAALLALAADLEGSTAVVLVGAVLAGQLTIGWGNDLLDAERDRAVGRTDKPLAAGRVTRSQILAALGAAGLACVALSLALGWRSAMLHLLLVSMGHAYNLGLKSTVWSWVPYAVAFGVLPGVVSLAGEAAEAPAWWSVGAGAVLGVGAHLLNVLPDLADDAASGVRGLPHRLGARASQLLAAALLGAASLLAALGPAGGPSWIALVALVAVAALNAVAGFGSGRRPFQAAILIALIDVALLVAAGR